MKEVVLDDIRIDQLNPQNPDKSILPDPPYIDGLPPEVRAYCQQYSDVNRCFLALCHVPSPLTSHEEIPFYLLLRSGKTESIPQFIVFNQMGIPYRLVAFFRHLNLEIDPNKLKDKIASMASETFC